MENLLSLTLEAHNAGQNHHRHYVVMVGRDLLDDWTVSIRYGRTGQHGAVSCTMPTPIRQRLWPLSATGSNVAYLPPSGSAVLIGSRSSVRHRILMPHHGCQATSWMVSLRQGDK